MRRRTVLATLAASLSTAASGCASLFGNDGSGEPTLTPADVPSASQTTTPGRGPADEVSVADLGRSLGGSLSGPASCRATALESTRSSPRPGPGRRRPRSS